MKKLIFLFLLIAGFALPTFAQQKTPTAEELAKKNVDELEKRLTLSSTQRSIAYNYVFNMYKEQLLLFKKQQAGTYKDEDETKIYRLQNETNANIKAVLKPEQIIEFNKLIEERLSGVDPTKKKKKKKGEEEEKVVGIEGLKTKGNN
ncbi:hypothetical protein [Pedobacter boryungensis]|uniref:DUF4890 domain-containing protein n=1 Tax=Pedobacter boryungensis TaxID=869962 RepID=A0ABX2DEK7_9SPHI|nr:hypothetical protein [Pedobacter boryungensis]NQX31391.1 hypothetical protein [Pedobacter boryungensis]